MKALLVSGSPHFPGPVVVDGVRAFTAAGYDVTYVSWAGPSDALVEAAGAVVVLGQVPAGGEGQRGPVPPRSTLERRLRQVRTLVGRPSGRVWSAVRRRPDVLAAAASADVLVAVDLQGVRAVARLARANPGPDAVYGIQAALATATAPETHATGGPPSS